MKKYLLFICLAFHFLGCGVEEQQRGLELTITKEFSLTEKTQNLLYKMYTVVSHRSDESELAFANFISPARIVITDYKGNLVDTLGGQGRGPKEIESARYFGFDEAGNIVVLDKALALFKYFDRNNRRVSSYRYSTKKGISVSSRVLQQCGEKWFLGIQMIGAPALPKTPTIGVFNKEFELIETLGGFDAFFEKGSGIMSETVVDVDCDAKFIYTSHAKLPFIQKYSIDSKTFIGRSKKVPNSFMLSDKFIKMSTSSIEMSRYLTEEQSLNLGVYHTNDYIYLIFRNDNYSKPNERTLNIKDHYVAAFSKKSMKYLGETKLEGAVLGTSKDGELIVLKDENNYTIQFVEVSPQNLN